MRSLTTLAVLLLTIPTLAMANGESKKLSPEACELLKVSAKNSWEQDFQSTQVIVDTYWWILGMLREKLSAPELEVIESVVEKAPTVAENVIINSGIKEKLAKAGQELGKKISWLDCDAQKKGVQHVLQDGSFKCSVTLEDGILERKDYPNLSDAEYLELYSPTYAINGQVNLRRNQYSSLTLDLGYKGKVVTDIRISAYDLVSQTYADVEKKIADVFDIPTPIPRLSHYIDIALEGKCD